MSDGFTTGKASGGTLQQLANIPAEYSADALEMARAQRLAQMLSSSPAPEGQMISGRYVAPSWTQSLAQLANAGVGAYFQGEAEDKQKKLAEQLRQDKMATLEGINTALDAGDFKKARAIASTRPEYSQEFLKPLIESSIPKAATPTSEMQNFNFAKTPEGGGYRGTFNQWQKEQANLKNLAPQAPQIVQTDQGMMMFDPNSRTFSPAMANGRPVMPPMDASAKNDLRDNIKQQTAIAGGLKAVQDTPSAFGWKRGATGTMLGESIANKAETEAETEARSYVFNIVSKVIHDRAGASQTPSEIAKINRFLPNEYDNSKAIERKLKGFQKFLQDEATAIKTPAGGANPASPAAPEAPPAAKAGEGKGHWEYRTFEGKQQRRWVAE